MTRINVGIHPMLLTDEHLLAEHREIKRLNNLILARIVKLKRKEDCTPIPDKFTLGKGHVLFFINKYIYTYLRYERLHDECIKRQFEVTDYSGGWDMEKFQKYIRPEVYEPSDEDRQLIIDRITERILSSRKTHFRYHHTDITKAQAIAILNIKHGLDDGEISDEILYILGLHSKG